MTAGEAMGTGRDRLCAAGIEDASVDAGLLLEEAAGISRAEALAHPERLLTREQTERYLSFLSRRETGEPCAYITGAREFMGLSFQTGPGVLIPRPDTETLVEEAMIRLHDGMRFLDLCTGTGCIALSLLHYSNDTTAVATDVSPEALRYARGNADALGLAGRLELLETDLFPVCKEDGNGPESARERFDLIVANPPYISTGVIAGLQAEVRDHEPSIALDGGMDGLDFYRRILGGVTQYLYSGGWLLVEIGFDQGETVRKLFEQAGAHGVRIVRDFGGHDRVAEGCFY